MKNYVIETYAGDSFSNVAKLAKEQAENFATNLQLDEETNEYSTQNVEFDFNGITCIVGANTDLEAFARDFSNAFLMKWKTIGPDCVVEYSDEVKADIEQRTEERKIASQKQREKWDREEREAAELAANLTQDVVFEVVDADVYNDWKAKNTDPYGNACFDYAEIWAKLMQVQIAEGKTIAEVAEETSSEADYMGITGFMYGMAVNILSKCWSHGEELRVWHNAKYNQTGEGVVNPAVLTIGVKSQE